MIFDQEGYQHVNQNAGSNLHRHISYLRHDHSTSNNSTVAYLRPLHETPVVQGMG